LIFVGQPDSTKPSRFTGIASTGDTRIPGTDHSGIFRHTIIEKEQSSIRYAGEGFGKPLAPGLTLTELRDSKVRNYIANLQELGMTYIPASDICNSLEVDTH
jgi:hypothetical protein